MAKKKRSAKKRDSLHMLIVESRFYDNISDELLAGATRVLDGAGARYDRVTVPGSLEIPAAIVIAMEAARRRRAPYDGVVALGCVIRGETYHFEVVANESARALTNLAMKERSRSATAFSLSRARPRRTLAPALKKVTKVARPPAPRSCWSRSSTHWPGADGRGSRT